MTQIEVVSNSELVNQERAVRANALQAEIVKSAQNMVQYAIEIGQILIEVKTSLSHGEWLPWVIANLEFSQQTASDYMRLAKSNYVRARNFDDVTSIREALKLIEPPKKPKLLPTRVSSDGTRYEPEQSRFLEDGEEEYLDAEFELEERPTKSYSTDSSGVNFFEDNAENLQATFRTVWAVFTNLTKSQASDKVQAAYYINALRNGLETMTEDINRWVENNPAFLDGNFTAFSEERDGHKKKSGHNFETVM